MKQLLCFRLVRTSADVTSPFIREAPRNAGPLHVSVFHCLIPCFLELILMFSSITLNLLLFVFKRIVEIFFFLVIYTLALSLTHLLCTFS